MSAFDYLDKHFKRPKPTVRLEPPQPGDPCSDPKCAGKYVATPYAREGVYCEACRQVPRREG